MISVKKKTAQLIVEKIEKFFLAGDLKPGSRLPSERDLASQFGVSRTSIREALQVLELNGAIIIRQGGGSYINTDEVQILSDQLAARIVEAEDHLVFDMLEVRRALEVESAALAAQRATPDNLESMRQALVQMKRSLYDAEKGIQADLHFHQRIVEASHNQLLINLVQSLAERMEDSIRTTRSYRFMDAERYEDTFGEHQDIYDAVASGDVIKAKGLMERHIDQISNELNLPAAPS